MKAGSVPPFSRFKVLWKSSFPRVIVIAAQVNAFSTERVNGGLRHCKIAGGVARDVKRFIERMRGRAIFELQNFSTLAIAPLIDENDVANAAVQIKTGHPLFVIAGLK